MRINRYLAAAGLGSRRKCETLVTDGRVKVNGRLLQKLASEVGEEDIVTVDGARVQLLKNDVYLMLHKPKGCVCTVSDELGRRTVMDFLDAKYRNIRLFPVGRLDYDTEGLLLLTTDGELSERLTHPRNEIEKTYVAKIEGEIGEDLLGVLRGGVNLNGVKTKRCKVKLLGFSEGVSRVEVKISEGRNRQVRRMFETINRDVIFLKRTAIGDLRLGGLTRGNCRELTEAETAYLKNV